MESKHDFGFLSQVRFVVLSVVSCSSDVAYASHEANVVGIWWLIFILRWDC